MHDAHYGGNLVDGAKMLNLFGDVATELLIINDGDEGLFCAYDSVEFLAPVYAADLLAQSKQANLFTLDQDMQLKKNKKKAMLNIQKKQASAVKVEQHNREKQRYVQQQSTFLKHLGITDEKGQIIPRWRVSGSRLINLLKFFLMPMNRLMLRNSN
jgi:hypothetical protein